jgi:hypothetical protein
MVEMADARLRLGNERGSRTRFLLKKSIIFRSCPLDCKFG